MIELDDSDLLDMAVLVVTFTDGRVERWGPASRAFAEHVAAQHKSDPPEGIASSVVEDVPE